MLTRFFRRSTTGQKNKSGQPADDDGDATVVLSSAECDEEDESGWKPGDVIQDRYRVEQVFSGAMGKVYIATHLGWGVKMAIKAPRKEALADEEGIQRIIREADGWVRLGLHPNIAACYYVLSIDNIPHIYIEYVNGGTLEEWIQEGRCNDMRTALTLAIQFCNGMEYTHSMGIIHRDIKPHNILITRDGLLKISDFGILQTVNEAEPVDTSPSSAKKRSADGNAGFIGTPNYASPEQLRNTHKVDTRTDIFSFGLCLWRMFCGKRPYKKNTEGICPEPTPADSRIILSPELTDILKKSVAHDPADRYQDFASFKEALNNVYLDLFGVACPYAIMGHIDLRAESLNNRAVSLAELGKISQAAVCLSQTLEINDRLPEALFNLLTLKWRRSSENPDRILRRIETTRKRFPDSTLFDDLEKEIREYLSQSKTIHRPVRNKNLELRLCLSKTPMEVFRGAQLRRSVQNNIITLLQRRNFPECYETLMTSWKHEDFKKEKFYFKIYEQLLPEGQKKGISTAQRITIQRGKKSGADLLIILPGKSTIYSAASNDCHIVGRKIGARKTEEKLTRLPTNISVLAASPKGNRLAIGLDDGSIVIYSFKNDTQSLLYEDSSGSSVARALSFTPDGRFILAGYDDGRVKRMECESRDVLELDIVEDGDAGIQCLRVLADSQFVAGSKDGSLRFADWKSGDLVRTIEAHGRPVSSLSVSPGGQWVVSCSADRLVKVWGLDGTCIQTFAGHEEPVSAVLALADEQTIVTGCEDDAVRLWNIQTGECSAVLDARGDGVCSLNYGPSSHMFLSGCNDGSIIMWTIIYELEFETMEIA
ncbi:MAG: serine/threonine protein kinase [Desulfobulbaceae bacterium]|uniref:Serine/threonine protein kinase n=1 Tax=Candidatus Desulfobia pelagia TaxID=2841692 RepID=A0A8J6NDT3_9BACT|nr:serine/threonine protein kinase [Candidatus Desulfobia pelagia]